MKKIVVLICFLLSASIIFGAGEQEVKSEEEITETSGEWTWANAAAPYKGDTIYVLLQTHPSTDATKKLLPEFEAATGINVELELLQRRAMNTKEEMELASKSCAYDVTHMAPPKRGRYARANWAEPLGKYINDEKLTMPDFNVEEFEPYIDLVTLDDTIYGIPFVGETALLFYRTDIFEKNGIQNPPATIEELEEVAAKINTEEIPGFCSRAVKGQGINVYTWSAFLKAYGGDFFNEDMEPIVNSAEAIKATEKYAELLNEYGPFGVASYSHYELSTDFAQGKLGMAFAAGAWGFSVFNDPSKSKIIGKWAAAPSVAGPAGAYSDAYCHGVMIPRNAQNKEAAWLFIQWMTSRETQLKRALLEGGDGSVTRSPILSVPEYREKWNVGGLIEAMEKSVGDGIAQELRPNELPEWMEVGDIIGAAVQQVIAGEAGAEEALNKANQDAYEIMAEAGYYD